MKIEIYSSQFCVYCIMAQRLLDGKGLQYDVYYVDSEAGKREEMETRAPGARTVPQIFINDQHIGGYTDLARLDGQGELEEILAAS